LADEDKSNVELWPDQRGNFAIGRQILEHARGSPDGHYRDRAEFGEDRPAVVMRAATELMSALLDVPERPLQ